MTTGEMIKQGRAAKNKSQEELANMLGVSRQAVSKWESDKSIPIGINRECLNNILEISLGLDEEKIDKLPSASGRNKKLLLGGWVTAGILLILLVLSIVYIFSRLQIANDASARDDIREEMRLEEKILNELCNKFQLDNDTIHVDVVSGEFSYMTIVINNNSSAIESATISDIKNYISENYDIFSENIEIIFE